MLRLLGVVVSVGLADSINPSTVGPALYLATGQKAAARVWHFTIGVFGVNLVVGLILTIGPGRLLVDLIPNPHGTVRHVIQLVAGVALLGLAAGLWLGRRRLARHELPGRSGSSGRSALILGASLTAVELPTAAPYFAVIAAVAASSATVPAEILLIALYNVVFVLPLVAIIVVLLAAGPRADPWLRKAGSWLQRRWPLVLATLLLIVGGALTMLGGTGLVKQ